MATMFLAPLARVGGMTLALALAAGTAKAQFPGSPPGKTLPPPPPATPVALPRDLVAVYQPTMLAESNSSGTPCTPHSHTLTSYLSMRRVLATPLPSGTKATLYKDGQPWVSWPVVTQTGSNDQPIRLGTFTYTINHDCAGGYTFTTPNPPNYRLVIDPDNQVAEASEGNNSFEFYMVPGATWVKIP